MLAQTCSRARHDIVVYNNVIDNFV